MSLTRYLPPPSDRMGILWTLLQIKDSIVLEYGTQGTTAYAMKTFNMLNFDISDRLFVTGLDENSVVMGSTDSLEEKILQLDKKYSPKVIFVMASSVSSVIGADVKGVCSYMQNQVKSKIITFTQGGFSGDFSSGINSCYTDLISNLSTEKYDIENCYNIIGVSAITSHSENDVLAINSLINKYFNLSPNAILSLDTNIEKIEKMSKAKINIVLSYEGLESAKLLKERFNTPYIYGLPIGATSTNNWLLEISNLLDISVNISPVDIVNSKHDKIAIYANYDELLAYKKLANELNIKIEFLLCTHNISKIADKPDDILYFKTEKEKINLFEKLNNTLILADNSFINHANKSNKKIDISSNIGKSDSILGYDISSIF